MSRFLVSIFLLGGLSFALAALPVFGQKEKNSGRMEMTIVDVNKAPLRDFALKLRRLDEEKRVDWTQPFSIEVEGVLTKDGKLSQAKIVKSDGDQELAKIAQQGILAVGDSGWLGYLRMQGVEKVKIVVGQTSENFSFSVVSELSTEARANTVTSGLNAMVNGALLLDKNGIKKLGDDERRLLSNTKVTSAEKTANIIFTMPAGEFREMARRQLTESQNKTNG